LRLKTLWPFPDDAVKELGERVTRVVFPEMNRGQVAGEIEKYCGCDVIPIMQTNGEILRPETILDVLRRNCR
jgi:2-oxoglutarate ferredoxin oxidoreductase subunit alpha